MHSSFMSLPYRPKVDPLSPIPCAQIISCRPFKLYNSSRAVSDRGNALSAQIVLEAEISFDISNYSSHDWSGSGSLVVVDDLIADQEPEAVRISRENIRRAEEVR